MATEVGFGIDADAVRWVTDPQTGERFIIDYDGPFREAITSFYSAICDHPNRSTFRVPAGASIQVREACPDCGAGFGNAMKQTDPAWVASLPLLEADKWRNYQCDRDAQQRSLMLEHARRQVVERGRFSRKYKEYMASPAWDSRRQKVIRRCGNTCEGCGEASVDHVHHTTYDNFGGEFLFELLGLCNPCHDRLHKDDYVLPRDEELQ